MVDIMAVLFMMLSAWFDSCPCHYEHPGAPDFTSRERRSYWSEKLRTPCVMVCRRAPEWAAGEVFHMLKALLDFAAIALLFELAAAGVGDEDRACIMQDFACIRRQLWFVFQIKFGHWQQLPWILFGLAHERAGIARWCVRRALQLFVSAP